MGVGLGERGTGKRNNSWNVNKLTFKKEGGNYPNRPIDHLDRRSSLTKADMYKMFF